MDTQLSLSIFQGVSLITSLVFSMLLKAQPDDKPYSEYVDEAYVQNLDDMYRKMSRYPSDKLTRMGIDMFTNRQEYDSAVVCLAIVKNRYRNHLSNEEKKRCLIATSASGYLSLYHYHDYARAYDCFDKAMAINEEIGYREENPKLCLNLGSLFLVSSYYLNSYTMRQEAKGYLEQGLKESYELKDWETYVKHFLYYSAQLINEKDDKGITVFLKSFKLREVPDTIENYDAARYRFEAMKAIVNGDYEQAVKELTSEINSDYASLTPQRYYAQALAIISEVLVRMGERERAIAALKKMQEMAQEYNLVELKPGVNRRIADIYKDGGDDANYALYYNRYTQAKDSLLVYHRMDQVGDKHLLATLSKVVEIEEKSAKRRKIYIVLSLLLLLLAAGTTVLTCVQCRKNKYLNKQNRLLNDRCQELEKTVTTQTDTAKNNLQKPDAPKKTAEESAGKYKGSRLSEEDKAELVRSIKETLENTEVFCQQSFTVEQMAQMLGSNTHYVSQVINECFGMNFNSLLAEHRVREACRRLDDEAQYGRLTIEAVAQSVGFKSRNTLIAAFKKVMGMTPSEYQKLSKE